MYLKASMVMVAARSECVCVCVGGGGGGGCDVIFNIAEGGLRTNFLVLEGGGGTV